MHEIFIKFTHACQFVMNTWGNLKWDDHIKYIIYEEETKYKNKALNLFPP